MRKSKNLPRTASSVFSPLFQNSYLEHVVKSPGIENKLKRFKEFKAQRPPKRLPAGFNDHTLHGRLEGFRECHLDQNVLLLYTDKHDLVTLIVVCNHDDLTQRAFAEKLKSYFPKTLK